jgi:hypothetical protein
VRYDSSGHWWLWIEVDHTLTRTTADDDRRTPVEGLPKVIAADW